MSTVDYSDFHSKLYAILREFKKYNDMLDIIQENYHDKYKSYDGPTQDEKDRIKAIWSRIDKTTNSKVLKALLYLNSDSRGSINYHFVNHGQEIYEILFGKFDIPSVVSLKTALGVVMGAPYIAYDYPSDDEEEDDDDDE